MFRFFQPPRADLGLPDLICAMFDHRRVCAIVQWSDYDHWTVYDYPSLSQILTVDAMNRWISLKLRADKHPIILL